jgi:hypothetical protein
MYYRLVPKSQSSPAIKSSAQNLIQIYFSPLRSAWRWTFTTAGWLAIVSGICWPRNAPGHWGSAFFRAVMVRTNSSAQARTAFIRIPTTYCNTSMKSGFASTLESGNKPAVEDYLPPKGTAPIVGFAKPHRIWIIWMSLEWRRHTVNARCQRDLTSYLLWCTICLL